MTHLNEYLNQLEKSKRLSIFQLDKIRSTIELYCKWYEDFTEYNLRSASIYLFKSESAMDIMHKYKRWLIFKHYIDHDSRNKARAFDYLWNKPCIYIDSHGAMWT